MTDLGMFAGDEELARDIERGRRQRLEHKWLAERHGKPPHCRAETCRKPINWLLTDAGRWMPIDLYPDPATGNVEIGWIGVAQVARIVDPDEQDEPEPGGPHAPQPHRYTSHFATCPEAGKYRKRRRPGGPDAGTTPPHAGPR